MTIINKTTGKQNTLKNAIKNGLLTTPENFSFDVIINTKTKRIISNSTANKGLENGTLNINQLLIPKNFITYNNRIFLNTKANQTKINKLKQNSKVFIYPITPFDVSNGNGTITLKHAAQESGFEGKVKITFEHILPSGEKEIKTEFYDIDDRPISQVFKYDENNITTFSDVEEGSFVKIEKLSNSDIQVKYANQSFKDSPNPNYHCVLSPIKTHFLNHKKSKSKDYVSIIDNFISKYSNGIPESDLKNICDILKISIDIYDLFNRKSLKFTTNNSRHIFKYINQKLNHLELITNYSLDTKNSTILSESELKLKYKELLENGENPLFTTDYNQNITCIYSANGTFELFDEYKIIREKFNNIIDLKKFKFSTTDKNLWQFLKSSVRTTTHKLFHNIFNYNEPKNGEIIGNYNCIYDTKDLKEYDLKKAYCQFPSNQYYIGFPSKMTNYQMINQPATKEFLNSHIGYFHIIDLDYSDVSPNTTLFFKSLGIENGIYSSPELLLFLDQNLKFTIEYGLWSIIPFYFDFFDYDKMISTGYYRKWTGQLNMFNDKITYKQKRLPYQNDFIGHLINQYPEEISVYNSEILFTKQKKTLSTYGHIGGFITAYTRIMMISELIKHNFDDILALKLDSFICKNHIKPHNELFIEKPVKVLNSNGYPFMNNSPIYIHEYFHQKPESIFDSQFDSNIILLNGQGGTGKTHSILTNTGFIDPIYSAIPWRLCIEKNKEYNVKSLSFASLVGKQFNIDEKIIKANKSKVDSYNSQIEIKNQERIAKGLLPLKKKKYMKTKTENLPYYLDFQINPSGHYPSNIIVDELTMLNNDDIDLIIKTYRYSRIFFIGDVSNDGRPYQTTFQTQKFNLSKIKSIITYTDDRRSKCEKLKSLKLELRKIRDRNISEADQKFSIFKLIKSLFPIMKLSEIKDIYNVNDWVLCSTKEGDNSRAKKINSVIEGEKYRVISHSKKDVFNRLNNNESYLNGDWIIGDKPNIPSSRYEKTNASTIHSIQGLTVEENKKIFIDLNNSFDVNLTYTAISRARNVNQLYFFLH